MRAFCRATLTACLVLPLSAGCAGHRPTHVAADESRPHITWEIRTGGDLGDDVLVCGSPEPTRTCVLGASSERNGRPVTVHCICIQPRSRPAIWALCECRFCRGRKANRVTT
jgi:hypothetical protein